MIDEVYVSILKNEGVITIVVGGTLDLTNYQEFYNGLESASNETDNVVVDLRKPDR